MAWVEKLPSGKWRGGYRDARGRKRQRTFTYKTGARQWANDGEEAVRRGMSPDSGRITVADWSARWMQARVVEPTTASNERHRMARIVAEFGDVPLDRLSTLDVQSWEKRLVAGGMGTGSLRCYHGLLTAMMRSAVQERLIADNPVRFVHLPPVPRGREVYLTPAEVEAVAAHMTPTPYDTVVRLQPYLGFRWGEIIGLRVSDLDMLRRTAQVRQVITEIGAARTVKPYPKTSSSFRTVPIPDLQAELLAAFLAANPRGRGELIFQTAGGLPLSRRFNSHAFARALERSGVTKAARPHDLRHSGASWLAQAGVPIFAVSKWLGHSSIATTMRYSHAAEGMHDEVAQALATLNRGTVVGQQGSTYVDF